jgi:serine/threonine-protein kinase RsbT
MHLQALNDNARRGLRLVFDDQGPGIPDIELAMKDGYTTGTGLGLGLSGARRLSSEFEIQSQVGKGTRVAITRWKG